MQENKQARRSSIFTIIYKHKLVGVILLRRQFSVFWEGEMKEVDKKGILEKLFLNWNIKNNFLYPGHKYAFLSVKYTHILSTYTHIHSICIYTIYSQYISITALICFIFCVYMYNKRYPYVFLKYTYITCTFTMTGLTELLYITFCYTHKVV